MACNDDRIFQFTDGAGGATYRLKVSGSKGTFTAHADFLDADTPPAEHWAPDQIIDPAERSRALEAGNAYVNSIVVLCVATHTTPVRVEASVDGARYCREVPCAQGKFERIVHFIRRT